MENASAIMAFISFLMFFVAILGLLLPKITFQKNRKDVIKRILLPSFFIFFLALLTKPNLIETEQDTTTTETEINTAEAEQEAKKKAEEEARIKADQEVIDKVIADAKAKAEREAKEKEEAEAKAKAEKEAKEKAEQEAKAKKKWYEGGTLHQENGLAWQQANDENKLATSADMVSKMWANNHLKKEIVGEVNTIDDLRPLAEKLAKQLDDAFKKDPDEKQNKQLFANQKVSETAALLMVMMKWTK